MIHNDNEILFKCSGIDPGIVNFAICNISFSGFCDYITEDRQEIEIPDINILNWELWDLKTLSFYTMDKITKKMVKRTLLEEGKEMIKSEDSSIWESNLIKFITNSNWLFTKYKSCLSEEEEEEDGDNRFELPLVFMENQCDHIKTGLQKIDIYNISKSFQTIVKTIDILNKEEREMCNKASKYKIPNDGSLDYNERKKKSIEVGSELLKQLGLKEWISFINAVKEDQKKTRSILLHDDPKVKKGKGTEKLDDLYDALGIAVQSCIKKHELILKDKRKKERERKKIIKSIELLEKEKLNEMKRKFTIFNSENINNDNLIMKKQKTNSSSSSLIKKVNEVNNNNKKRKSDIINSENVNKFKKGDSLSSNNNSNKKSKIDTSTSSSSSSSINKEVKKRGRPKKNKEDSKDKDISIPFINNSKLTKNISNECLELAKKFKQNNIRTISVEICDSIDCSSDNEKDDTDIKKYKPSILIY